MQINHQRRQGDHRQADHVRDNHQAHIDHRAHEQQRTKDRGVHTAQHIGPIPSGPFIAESDEGKAPVDHHKEQASEQLDQRVLQTQGHPTTTRLSPQKNPAKNRNIKIKGDFRGTATADRTVVFEKGSEGNAVNADVEKTADRRPHDEDQPGQRR